MNTPGQRYKKLELISDDASTRVPSRCQVLRSFLKRFVLGSHCFTAYGFEIHKVSNLGTLSEWYAYNPTLGQTIYLESEQDLQQWLEEQFFLNKDL
jgi:hypothetical protein